MHGHCPDCGTEFDASTPPALVDLILEHPCGALSAVNAAQPTKAEAEAAAAQVLDR